MHLKVHNRGFELHRCRRGQFCGRVVDIKIDGMSLETPKAIPNSKELGFYSQNDKETGDLSVIQYILQLRNFGAFQNSTDQIREFGFYDSFIRANGESVVDFFVQYPQNLNLSNEQQIMLMNLQDNTASKFVSYFEKNRNQPADDYEKEIVSLRDVYEDKVFTPSIHMKTEKEGLIREKLGKFLDNGFERLNVIYASIRENQANWFALSDIIYDKDVWVNVTGVLPRMTIKEKFAIIPWSFLFGASTSSLGKPWSGSRAYPRHLTRTTSCFDVVDESITYPKSRVENIKETNEIAQDVKTNILQGGLFGNIVHNRRGLKIIVNNLS